MIFLWMSQFWWYAIIKSLLCKGNLVPVVFQLDWFSSLSYAGDNCFLSIHCTLVRNCNLYLMITGWSYLFKALIQKGELVISPHNRRRHRILWEATLRLFLHEQELFHLAIFTSALVIRQGAVWVKVIILALITILFLIVNIFPFVIIPFFLISIYKILTPRTTLGYQRKKKKKNTDQYTYIF